MIAFLLLVACPAPAPVAPAGSTGPPAPARDDLAFVEVPSGRADEALPLVIAVHGLGDRPESLSALVGGCQLPVRIVAPRGPDPHGGGYSWFAIAGDPPVTDADGVARSADRLAELIATLRSTREVVGEPVITGFSQGGTLSFAVAARHPDGVGAAVPIAGVLPEALLPSGPPPAGGPVIRALHGASDPRATPEAARGTVAALQARGWDASLAVFEETGHAVTLPVRQALCAEIARAIAH